jgi:hypothetical protein
MHDDELPMDFNGNRFGARRVADNSPRNSGRDDELLRPGFNPQPEWLVCAIREVEFHTMVAINGHFSAPEKFDDAFH